ncbi:hypothetical protein BUALT_Bualt13G0009800 [Buddleja alternifolia]|uniref:RING-type domain-containing protein n=1 Tax=Buddleja alternifolia TaxID=168488 RepID=A0AAV6WQG3_9LAMI|nr:hypothetical protein BUALT_Bualt13G0009800 [Buddleja alternifolia]
MGDSSSNVDSSPEQLSPVLVNEKGSRNKRKFPSDSSVHTPVNTSTLSLTEFPRYEMLEEKFRNALNELGSMMLKPEDTVEEQEEEEYQEADWDDPVACQLEELLTNNLFATFCSAVKKIIESGYTEEVAEWAVLNSPVFHGSQDAVSNVVEGALALLKREKEFNTPKLSLFEGLQSLVDYTLLEMIHVLREVKPGLTIAEAMWCLLISDLNLLNACLAGSGGPSDGSSGKEASGENTTLSQKKSENLGSSQSDSDKLDDPKQTTSRAQSSQPGNPVSGPAHQLPSSKAGAKGKFVPASSLGTMVDDKSGGSKKVSSANSKRDMLRQKTFQFEKNYKGRVSKGAFKARVAAWGNMVLDKSFTSSVLTKGTYSRLAAAAGPNSDSLLEKELKSSSSSQPCVKDTVFALPAVKTKSPASSIAGPDPSPKGEIDSSDRSKTAKETTKDYYSAIPFDEILQKYVPGDDKDESILMLIRHKEVLEKELQSWTDWANEKVMQAARRLGKDKGELKMLRQEKEEIEKLKKDKQNLEESNLKRLSEMEYALSNATGQINVANSTVRRLEGENSVLKKEMERAKLQALRSTYELQEAMVREQEAVKKSQSWDAEKGLFMEEVTNLKRQNAELDNRLEKIKRRHDQFKVLLKQEEKEKSKAATQIDALRAKKEEEEAQTTLDADSIKRAAQTNMQNCEERIKNLENLISGLRLESDKSKIAALNVGYGNALASDNISKILGGQPPKKRLAVFEDNFGAGDVKPERECVMCMTDEISVVFIPCAHQVLCGQCNDRHEKQGMNDCPSCRTTIQKRIPVTYRAD